MGCGGKMKLRPFITGIATFLPGISLLVGKTTGGTCSSRYCYSVWLRHMVMAKMNRLNPYPKIIAELGPGDSLGIGMAALISGCDKYFAFDVVEYASVNTNLKIFDELVDLFKNKTPIPDEVEFPLVKPYLNNYNFPTDIFDKKRIRDALDSIRLERIKKSISDYKNIDSLIQYKAPWNRIDILEKESVDIIYSQAVLEHIDDLKDAYNLMKFWLRPNGYISHQIDFKCHNTANEWNGHWTYPDYIWKIIRGKRPYLINREPHSRHISILIEEGFDIVCDQIVKSESRLKINDLSNKFKFLSNDDLVTSGSFIQAVKR